MRELFHSVFNFIEKDSWNEFTEMNQSCQIGWHFFYCSLNECCHACEKQDKNEL